MASLRQVESARANGCKSRGPVTPEGKARSARNALKHGLASPHATAESVCLNTESRDEFTELHQALIDEYQPVTASEALLVEEMAVHRFRMQRAWATEAALLDQERDRLTMNRRLDRPKSLPMPPPATPADAFANLTDNGSSLQTLHRYEARLSNQFDRALRRLLDLRAKAPAVLPDDPDPAINRPPLADMPSEPDLSPTKPENPSQPIGSTSLTPAPSPTPPAAHPSQSSSDLQLDCENT